MQVDPQLLGQQETYKLLIGCVSTVSQDGIYNLAPFSFFNGVGSNPPAISVSIIYTADTEDYTKDTLRNIRTIGEFAVNIVSEDLARAMNETAVNYPPD